MGKDRVVACCFMVLSTKIYRREGVGGIWYVLLALGIYSGDWSPVDFIQVFPSCCLASIWVWSRQNTGRHPKEGGERATGIYYPGFVPLGSPQLNMCFCHRSYSLSTLPLSYVPLSGFCNHTSSTYFFTCKSWKISQLYQLQECCPDRITFSKPSTTLNTIPLSNSTQL